MNMRENSDAWRAYMNKTKTVGLKTIRIIPFSGNEEDWNRWSKTFMTTATVKRCRDFLVPIDPDTDACLKDNIQAYNDLILSCQEDISFGMTINKNPQTN
jgi:ABC-type Zn uptake system ZnuABC Zn-binding protein ZnuA